MQSSIHRRLWVLLIAGFAAIACWIWIPGTPLDRADFKGTCFAFYNPPLFVKGSGRHQDPWTLTTFATVPAVDPSKAPVIVALDDDRSGFFQETPHSPLDVAVVLTNIRRLGARDAATSAVLAWNAPDPMGLAALDKVIGGFRSIVMSAPLSRAAVPEPMPTAFRNASIPLARVDGDASLLPIVNRIPLPGIILGTENCTAGFQSLDTENGDPCRNLLAVWDDRVVFSFPLALVVRNAGIPPERIEIRPGEYIRLGDDGPVVPIDRYGRITLKPESVRPVRILAAADVIDAPADTLPEALRDRMILRDDRSVADSRTRAVSNGLVDTFAAISSDAGLGKARVFQRPSRQAEGVGLAILLAALLLISKLAAFPRNVALLVAAVACGSTQYLALDAGYWLPGFAALAAVAATWIVSMVVPLRAIHPGSRMRRESRGKPVRVPKLAQPAVDAALPETVGSAMPEKPVKARKSAKTETNAKPAKPRRTGVKPDQGVTPPATDAPPRKATKKVGKKAR